MSIDGEIVQRVRDRLLERGVTFPGWEDGDQPAFRSAVAETLVALGLQRQVGAVQPAAAEIAGRLTGVGILQPLLDDPADTIQEIVVRQGWVQVEREGRIADVGRLAPDAEFQALVTRTADQSRRRLTGSQPYVLADLPDGSRFTAIVPPLSAGGTAINVRRFPRHRLALSDLEARGMFLPPQQEPGPAAGTWIRMPDADDAETTQTPIPLAEQMLEPLTDSHAHLPVFLARVARGVSASLLISGEFSSGESTLLGALASLVPPHVQVAVVETFKEVQLDHPHPLRVVVPDDRPDFPGMDEVLNVVITRMRPDLLLIGEIVRDEAPRFLDAVNLGKHAWATIHAGNALGALYRLETKALASGLPHRAVREQIALSVNLVVHLALTHGRRHVAELALVRGLDEQGHYALEYLPVGRVPARQERLWKLWHQREERACTTASS
jgi:pilus assembly protein CpaF